MSETKFKRGNWNVVDMRIHESGYQVYNLQCPYCGYKILRWLQEDICPCCHADMRKKS